MSACVCHYAEWAAGCFVRFEAGGNYRDERASVPVVFGTVAALHTSCQQLPQTLVLPAQGTMLWHSIVAGMVCVHLVGRSFAVRHRVASALQRIDCF
jgi:hypothetical protein